MLLLFSKNKRIFKNDLRKLFLFGCIFCILISSLLLMQKHTFAASTPRNQLLKQIGSGAPTSWGDYISSTGGLDTYYSYFIEVPSGTGRLVIRIYDADVGISGGASDWTNDSFNTSCTYNVYDPNGNTVTQNFTSGNNTSPAGSDSSWTRLYRVNNPMTRPLRLNKKVMIGVLE